MKLLKKLEQSKDIWFLLATFFGFFLLRLPSLFEPYWYGDEGIYEVIGFALRHGRLLYQGIWDNKPPLLYLMYAIVNGNQGGAKFLSLIAGLGAVFVFFYLSKRFFTDTKIIFTTTGIFAFLLASPLLEGNIANAENFMILPILLAGYCIVFIVQKINDGYTHASHSSYKILNTLRLRSGQAKYFILLFSGLLLGIAFLFKVVAVFDFGAFGLFAFYVLCKNRREFFPSILKLFPLGIGFVLPILLTAFYFASKGLLNDFIHSTFSSNVGYVNYSNQLASPIGGLFVPQGFLIIKLFLLGIFCLWIFFKREKMSIRQLFISIWLAFSLFNALFSGRPYTHYMLALLGSLSLFIGLTLYDKKLQKIYSVLLLVLILFLGVNFTFYTKSLGYFGNFISFMSNHESVTAYRTFFDQATPRDYDIATFYQRHKKPGDTLFVWGDNGQVYKLAGILPPGRFIVAYHMTMTKANRQETADLLKKNPPKFIVILPNRPVIPMSLENYSEIVIIGNAVIYERNF